MRAIRGFDRPALQWTFVAIAIILIALAASLAVAVRRLSGTVRELRAAQLQDRVDRERLQGQLAREQSTREALTLELGRVRAGLAGGDAHRDAPTLTLQPLHRREAAPPAPTMDAPPPARTIELRLVLPRHADPKLAPFDLSVRDWVTGQARLARGGLKASPLGGGHAVTAYVPGDVFASGSHEVILRSGQSEIATYEITVR